MRMRNSDRVFKALANRSRRILLDRLNANEGQTLPELCVHLDMTRQVVARHLAVLESAHLVVKRQRGREKRHFLNLVALQEIFQRDGDGGNSARGRVPARSSKGLPGRLKSTWPRAGDRSGARGPALETIRAGCRRECYDNSARSSWMACRFVLRRKSACHGATTMQESTWRRFRITSIVQSRLCGRHARRS